MFLMNCLSVSYLKPSQKNRNWKTHVHGGECLACLFTMAIDNVGDNTGGSELDSQIDQAHTDNNYSGD